MSQLIEQNSFEQIDVFRLSRDNLIVVLFAKTQSPYFDLAVSIGKGASAYRETKAEKSAVYTCVFSRALDQAGRAITLLRYVDSWTTTQIFVGGRLFTGNKSDVQETLKCYQQACCCASAAAHCQRISDDLFIRRERIYSGGVAVRIVAPGESASQQGIPVKPKRYVIPCRRLHDYVRIERDHPASWQNQVQAMAVHYEVDWCPLFDLSKFRQYE